MNQTPHANQFAIIRETAEVQQTEYPYDGLQCPACGKPTVQNEGRRYCNWDRCNAMIVMEGL